MRLAVYAGASTAAAACCLLKAFHQRPNFYSATVYLSQSNACLLILANLLVLLSCSFVYGLQRILYGPLRPIEIEQLSEKAWYAVLDTLLAMPSFREDVGGWLVTMFVLLLAGKVWSWVGEGRVDILEQQPPANPRLFHARLSTSLLVSVAFDLYMLNYCIETVMSDPRPGMMVIFTFEFAILSVFSIFTFSRYMLSVVELFIQKKQLKEAIAARKIEIQIERAASSDNELSPNAPIDVDENEVDVPGWEDKRRYLFGLEVFNDFVKLMIYIVFFTVSITFNGLPMHIMRDVYMTFASFSKRITDYIAYRKATSDMNTRYPDATTEEIRGDACIVCREGMVAWGQTEVAGDPPVAPTGRRDEGLRAKKLPCGHILHLRCLKAWLERQQVCPTCRRPVVTAVTPAQPNAAAPGANPGAANQRPAQNRARIFNLGPIRIGFLNGPGDQIQNVIQQMQGQNQAQHGAHGQPGQNHQGQVQTPAPSASPSNLPPNGTGISQTQPTQSGAIASTITTQLSHAPTSTHEQLAQIEQRLLQEASNLRLEQRHLYTVNALEVELARLRALQAAHLPPVGSTFTAQRHSDSQVFAARLEELRGSTTEPLSVGDALYPQGLILPEGWSIVPLRNVHPAPTSIQAQNLGPTDDNDSPYFVPATTVTTSSAPQDIPSNVAAVADVTPTQPTTTAVDTSRAAQSSAANIASDSQTTKVGSTASSTDGPEEVSSAPWQSNDWSFTASQEPNVTESKAEATEFAEAAYSGKGKGKAVEVEDAPDPDS